MLAFLTLLSLEKTECDVIISISILNIEKNTNIGKYHARTGSNWYRYTVNEIV